MIFILVPNSRLIIWGIVSICDPAPEPPTMNSLAIISSHVLIGDSCQATQTAVAVFMAPSQLNSRESNCAALVP